MKNCQNKQTAQAPSSIRTEQISRKHMLKRDPVRKLRKMVNSNREDWKALARKAANEQDPKKLLSIVEELNKALEERENQLRGGVSKRIATKREGGNELLLVDDEPGIRLTLLPIFEERGFHVQVAANVIPTKKLDFTIKESDMKAKRCCVHPYPISRPAETRQSQKSLFNQKRARSCP